MNGPRTATRTLVAFAATVMLLFSVVMVVAGVASALSSGWSQVGADIDGEAALDHSGRSVSLSADGTRIAIGADGNDGSASDAGHVRVFDLNKSSWVQAGSDIDGEAAGDGSGRSVSLSADGSRVAIGANGNDGSAPGAGHVRVFTLIDKSWVQVGGDIDGEAAGDGSGWSVSLSADGSRVAIGANGNDGSASGAGHVRVFTLNGGSWRQLGGDIDGEAFGDFSGWSVSLSADGSRVAIGAISNDGSGSAAGHVRLFSQIGASWVQVGGDIDGEAAGDGSGRSVSLSADGSRVAIGAISNDGSGSAAGHVRVFNLNDGSWVQVGADIDGEATGDGSGRSVSLSADGSRVAIGAEGNDGSGSDAGHVRVFNLNDGSWVQVGADIDGEAVDDFSGWAVSLSADGSRVGIGALTNNGAKADSGHVRVFDAPAPVLCAGKVVTIDMTMGAAGVGTGGDDVILGTNNADMIDAGAGNDTVCAGDGDDTVIGGDGNDMLLGEAGRDIIRGNAGTDNINGGPGNDRLLGGIDNDVINGDEGDDYIGGFGGADTINGGLGNETIFGGFGPDIIEGGPGNDTIRGLIGDDTINGGDGNDTLDGDRGNDTINGGAGNDTVSGGNADDILNGDDGDDQINGGKADDTMSGGLGTDTCAGNKHNIADTADATCNTIFGVP